MRLFTRCLVAAGVGLLSSIAGPLILAQNVPNQLPFQGVVDVDGVPFTGIGQFKFALISPGGATSHWSNDGTSVAGSEPAAAVTRPVEAGAYSVSLGDAALANMSPVPAGIFATNPDLHLRVWFNNGVLGFQQLEPDQPIGSVGYAMLSERTASLSAGALISGANIPDGTLGTDHLATPGLPLAGQVLAFNGDGLAWTDPAPGGGGDSVFSLNGVDAYYNAGRVGIGTASPAGALHVAGGGLSVTGESSPYTGAGSGVFIEDNPTFGGHVFAYDYGAGTPRSLLLNYPGGSVGIGTATPRGRTEIETVWDSDFNANLTLSGSRPSLVWRPSGLSGDHWLTQMHDGDLTFYSRFRTSLGGGIDTGWVPQLSLLNAAGELWYAGRLNKLDTSEQFGATLRVADFLFGHSTRRGTPGRALVDWNDGAGLKALVLNWANDWQETHIGGAVTQVQTLRITGGADLSEPFAMSHPGVSPGSVVVIDEQNPGKLRMSTTAYDKKVAGIVSGANGIQPAISMIQENLLEAGENVALSGRVYVNANDTGGRIEPGDLLTTSDVPGEAMKASDPQRASGAILGKAMTRLETESGIILVLVSLQ